MYCKSNRQRLVSGAMAEGKLDWFYRQTAFSVLRGQPLGISISSADPDDVYLFGGRLGQRRLLRDPRYREIYNEERVDFLAQDQITAQDIASEYEYARELAVHEANPAALVAATKAKAQVLGLDTQNIALLPSVIEIAWKDTAPIPAPAPVIDHVD